MLQNTYIKDGWIYKLSNGSPIAYINNDSIYDLTTGQYIYYIKDKWIYGIPNASDMYWISNDFIYKA